ncbi:hypothetical protein ACFC0K_41165, partial [Streptomyces hydrogenans]|uniref:hypothetical protein n=1 Tax=Streptomyces hydrogenans TaxID=1873719 RepID=UPI0035DDC2B1
RSSPTRCGCSTSAPPPTAGRPWCCPAWTSRAQLLADAKALLPQIKEAALAAARIDAPRSRIQQLSKVSTAVVYGWFDEAGLPKLKGGKGGV